MDTGRAALGVIAGIAAGALLGILFAPAKGSVTRRRIVHKGEEYVDDLKEKFEDLLESVTDKYDELKRSIDHHVKD
jgi:gas vesicle protein